MCDHGFTVPLDVPIKSGEGYVWKKKPVDRCINDIVRALNDGGVLTAGACCGHGKNDGEIILHDGRILAIRAERI